MKYLLSNDLNLSKTAQLIILISKSLLSNENVINLLCYSSCRSRALKCFITPCHPLTTTSPVQMLNMVKDQIFDLFLLLSTFSYLSCKDMFLTSYCFVVELVYNQNFALCLIKHFVEHNFRVFLMETVTQINSYLIDKVDRHNEDEPFHFVVRLQKRKVYKMNPLKKKIENRTIILI